MAGQPQSSNPLPGRKVTKSIPSYLRIHREDELTEHVSSGISLDTERCFWSAYEQVTGWRLQTQGKKQSFGVELLPAVNADRLEADELEGQQPVGKSMATRLAQSATEVFTELRDNRQAMRRMQSELALRAAALGRDVDRQRLADNIESTLADAAAASHCDAAIIYTLDDNTEYLEARFQYGLPPKALDAPPRLLRDSRGDLESMVQGVVVIDDLNDGPADTWNCPLPFAAGICVVIQAEDVPVGTLWLLCNQRREFGIAETAAARMAASSLALQLTSAPKVQRPANATAPIHDMSTWQFESLPIGAEIADDWRVDGMIESPRDWATGWHTWDVLPDGTLMLAIAEAAETSVRGAMHASIARAAVVAHTGYRHTPAQLMQRVSDTLWQTSTGEQLVSLLYVRVDPETGEGEVASAGSITAVIGNRYGIRPLVSGNGEPLNAHVDARFAFETFRMTEGETLLAYTAGMENDGASQRDLAEQVRTSMQAGDNNPLACIRRHIASLPLQHERGAVTITRKTP